MNRPLKITVDNQVESGDVSHLEDHTNAHHSHAHLSDSHVGHRSLVAHQLHPPSEIRRFDSADWAMHKQAKDDDVDSLFDNPSTPDTEHEFDDVNELVHNEESQGYKETAFRALMAGNNRNRRDSADDKVTANWRAKTLDKRIREGSGETPLTETSSLEENEGSPQDQPKSVVKRALLKPPSKPRQKRFDSADYYGDPDSMS